MGGIAIELTYLYFLQVFTVAFYNLSERVPDIIAQRMTFKESSNEETKFLVAAFKEKTAPQR